MNPETPNLSRRRVLAGIGSAAAVAAGGAGLLASMGSAAAQTFTIDGTEIVTNDGEVAWVGVDIKGRTNWDGFDEPVDRLRFVSEIKIAGEDWHTLLDTTSDPLDQWSAKGDSDGWGGGGEWVEYTEDGGREGEVRTDAQWAVIADPGHRNYDAPAQGYRDGGLNIPDWTDALSVGQDGGSDTTAVSKRSTVHFLDANGNEVGVGSTQASDSFSVTVVNQQSETGGTSNGDSAGG